MKDLEEIELDDYSVCHVCRSRIKKEGQSLHCWSIEYICGASIIGFVGQKEVYIDKKCKI